MKLIVPQTTEQEFESAPWKTGRFSMVLKEVQNSKIVPEKDIIFADEVDKEELLLVHTKEYLDKVFNYTMSQDEQRRLEVPLEALYIRQDSCFCNASILAAFHALDDGVAVNLGGGKHHAFPTWGEGFCIFNDIAVTIRSLELMEQVITNALVVDCDAHQGNGTAHIFKNDSNVVTFSIHMREGYPYHRPASDLDINLSNDTGDEIYLEQLKEGLDSILEQYSDFDLAIYIAGADPYEKDPLTSLNISIEGLRLRDEFVLSSLRKNNIPVVVLFAGGYADASDIVKINCNTIKTALKYAR